MKNNYFWCISIILASCSSPARGMNDIPKAPRTWGTLPLDLIIEVTKYLTHWDDLLRVAHVNEYMNQTFVLPAFIRQVQGPRFYPQLLDTITKKRPQGMFDILPQGTHTWLGCYMALLSAECQKDESRRRIDNLIELGRMYLVLSYLKAEIPGYNKKGLEDKMAVVGQAQNYFIRGLRFASRDIHDRICIAHDALNVRVDSRLNERIAALEQDYKSLQQAKEEDLTPENIEEFRKRYFDFALTDYQEDWSLMQQAIYWRNVAKAQIYMQYMTSEQLALPDRLGETPLLMAIQCRTFDLASKIIDRVSSHKINSACQTGKTPLSALINDINSGKTELFLKLIRAMPWNDVLNDLNRDKGFLLTKILKEEYVDFLEGIVEVAPPQDLHCISGQSKSSFLDTLIFWAIRQGYPQAAKTWLARYNDYQLEKAVKSFNSESHDIPALLIALKWFAIDYNYHEIVTILLKYSSIKFCTSLDQFVIAQIHNLANLLRDDEIIALIKEKFPEAYEKRLQQSTLEKLLSFMLNDDYNAALKCMEETNLNYLLFYDVSLRCECPLRAAVQLGRCKLALEIIKKYPPSCFSNSKDRLLILDLAKERRYKEIVDAWCAKFKEWKNLEINKKKKIFI